MKKITKFLSLLVLALTAVTLVACDKTTEPTSKPTSAPTTLTTSSSKISDSLGQVNFITTNDNHGQVLQSGVFSSISQLAGCIEKLEKNNGQYIKIQCGDLMQGSYISSVTRGKIMVECINAMNFDCMVLGNHEFDWGLDEIYKFYDGNEENGEANFPLLCANLIDNRTNERPDWIESYIILDYNDVKVGIIGAIGEDQKSDILTEYVKDYEFMDVTESVLLVANEIRDDVDILVVAMHEYKEGNVDAIAAYPVSAKVDLIVSAHTHQFVEKYVKRSTDTYKIPVVQCDDKNENLGEIIISLNEDKTAKKATITHHYPTSKDSSSKINEVLNNYTDLLPLGEEILANNPRYLNKLQLGLLACDIMASDFDCDIALMNMGGIRNTLAKGDITINDIFSIFPFENKVYKVQINGNYLKSFLEYYGGSMYYTDGFVISSIDTYETYNLAIIDFVYTDTYYQNIFKNTTYIDTEVLLRDSIIDYFKNK